MRAPTALFLFVPRIIEAGGLPVASHWKIYLPVMGLAFVMMVPAIIVAEKRGKMKGVLLSAIGLVLVGQLLLRAAGHTVVNVAAILFVYFLGFNILEALQPSLVSKLAPGTRKGAVTGAHNWQGVACTSTSTAIQYALAIGLWRSRLEL